MENISLSDDPHVIERILCHLGLWNQQTALSERKKAREHGLVVIEDLDDGWLRHEEPVIVDRQASEQETVPTSRRRSSLSACLPGPLDRGAGQTSGHSFHTKKPPSQTTCPILAPTCLNLVRKSRQECA